MSLLTTPVTITIAEAYLENSRTTLSFCKNSEQQLFLQRNFITDIELGFKLHMILSQKRTDFSCLNFYDILKTCFLIS